MSDPPLDLGPGSVSDAAEQTWLDFWLANLVALAPWQLIIVTPMAKQWITKEQLHISGNVRSSEQLSEFLYVLSDTSVGTSLIDFSGGSDNTSMI